jgi:hypothetical protein
MRKLWTFELNSCYLLPIKGHFEIFRFVSLHTGEDDRNMFSSQQRSSFKVLWFTPNEFIQSALVRSKCSILQRRSSFKVLWFIQNAPVYKGGVRSKYSSLQNRSSFKVLWFIQNALVYKGGVCSKCFGAFKML